MLLDAGHGGRDPGATGTTIAGETVLEKDLTLAVVDAAATRLQRSGFTTVLSRSVTSDTAADTQSDKPLTAATILGQLTIRARCANTVKAAALISVHVNSFADSSIRGAETIYEQHRALAPASRRLARTLQNAVLAELSKVVGRPVPDRGLIDDSAGGESTRGHLVLLGPAVPGYIQEPTRMPSALIEPAFITNPAEATLLRSARGTDALARAIAGAVEQFVGPNPARRSR